MLREFEAQRKCPFFLQTAQVHFAISDAKCLQSFVVYDFLTSHASSPKIGAVRTAGVTGREGSLAGLPEVAIRTWRTHALHNKTCRGS
jgi:hypothetical protein